MQSKQSADSRFVFTPVELRRRRPGGEKEKVHPKEGV